jgi:hypothetical protein
MFVLEKIESQGVDHAPSGRKSSRPAAGTRVATRRFMGKTQKAALVALLTIGAGKPDAFDQKADAVMKRMSDYLAKLQSFSFVADHTTEVVLENGQKLQFGARSDVKVKRPNMVRSDRLGQAIEATLFYDGKNLTIYTPKNNFYATTPAPPTLDQAVDFAGQKLGMETPAGDLISSDVFGMLTKDAIGSMYVGRVMIDGTWCDQVAYRGKDTDFQLWIQEGDPPLPRKYVITTKNVPASPEFGVELSEWVTDAELPEEQFTFVPPKGAERIEFLALADVPRKQQPKNRGQR